jgi:hypothetical protein
MLGAIEEAAVSITVDCCNVSQCVRSIFVVDHFYAGAGSLQDFLVGQASATKIFLQLKGMEPLSLDSTGIVDRVDRHGGVVGILDDVDLLACGDHRLERVL